MRPHLDFLAGLLTSPLAYRPCARPSLVLAHPKPHSLSSRLPATPTLETAAKHAAHGPDTWAHPILGASLDCGRRHAPGKPVPFPGRPRHANFLPCRMHLSYPMIFLPPYRWHSPKNGATQTPPEFRTLHLLTSTLVRSAPRCLSTHLPRWLISHT